MKTIKVWNKTVMKTIKVWNKTVMKTIKVWNKTKSKFIKFNIKDWGDCSALMKVFAKYGYGFVLYGAEEEGEDHGYKDTDRQ